MVQVTIHELINWLVVCWSHILQFQHNLNENENEYLFFKKKYHYIYCIKSFDNKWLIYKILIGYIDIECFLVKNFNIGKKNGVKLFKGWSLNKNIVCNDQGFNSKNINLWWWKGQGLTTQERKKKELKENNNTQNFLMPLVLVELVVVVDVGYVVALGDAYLVHHHDVRNHHDVQNHHGNHHDVGNHHALALNDV